MIKLSRLNGSEIVVNPELIEWIEANPDTTLTLATGSKVIVRNPVDEVISKITDYRKSLAASGVSPAQSLLKTYIKENK